ncbi:hypothetical protein JHK87_043267 [Glycine soja]|nr:hypothetical protein JHK87_043267 [Glycine soja]
MVAIGNGLEFSGGVTLLRPNHVLTVSTGGRREIFTMAPQWAPNVLPKIWSRFDVRIVCLGRRERRSRNHNKKKHSYKRVIAINHGSYEQSQVLVRVKFLPTWSFIGCLCVCFVEPPYCQIIVKPMFTHGLDVTELLGIAGWLAWNIWGGGKCLELMDPLLKKSFIDSELVTRSNLGGNNFPKYVLVKANNTSPRLCQPARQQVPVLTTKPANYIIGRHNCFPTINCSLNYL